MANENKCVICNKETDWYFHDSCDTNGTFWAKEGISSEYTRFPQAYICSKECLHKYIDKCFEEIL